MSPKRTTAPPARKHSRSSSSGQEGLIAKEKTKKQSAKRRTVLDNRFHRTLSPLTWGEGTELRKCAGRSCANWRQHSPLSPRESGRGLG